MTLNVKVIQSTKPRSLCLPKNWSLLSPFHLHALFQHVKRSVIAANYWSQSLLKEPDMLPPTDYGWVWNDHLGIWMSYWSDVPDVSSGCALIIRCGCKVVCKGNCKCSRNSMRCTSLCACQGMCINNEQYDNWISNLEQFDFFYLKGFWKYMVCSIALFVHNEGP